MGRPRQPIELIQAKGKKHLTKEEIRRRKESQPDPQCKDVEAPDYLPESLKSKFEDIAQKLLDLGVMTELDEDCLARYLLAEQLYLKYTSLLNKAARGNDLKGMRELQTMQDKAFKQCRAGASDLGLTISSRCRLVVPEPPQRQRDNKFSRFEE